MRAKMSAQWLENRPLFKECLEILDTQLLPEQEADRISALFNRIVPMTTWGKVDWNKINKKVDINGDPENIIPALEKLLKGPVDKTVYIEWSTGGIPVIKADLDAVVKFFDYVTCVSFDKFIFNPSAGYIIEVLPDYTITVGLFQEHQT